MDKTIIQQNLYMQKAFFTSGTTQNIKFRKESLKKLYTTITNKKDAIEEALNKDLGKSSMEGFMCEVGLVIEEIKFMIKHLKSFSKEKKVPTPITNFHSVSKIKPSPYGVCLIMSPWNYPFLLTMTPLVDALAAGNTAFVKPSAYSPNTSNIIKEILEETFSPEYVSVVTGGREENEYLLSQKFNYIFFTGSKDVGKLVMQKASENLIPVTLELGGKSPCIVDEAANIKLAAKRIVFGKFLNCGQTCVAPDYILCHKSVKDELVAELKKQIQLQFGTNPLENKNYGKIINKKHFERLLGLINKEKVVHGGNSNEATLQIEPTIMDNVSFEDSVMLEEIFGPIMPIVTYSYLDVAIDSINTKDSPLALYIFTSKKEVANKVTEQCTFGGCCVNDTVMHLVSTHLPFGGVGESGMGSYHGKFGFDTFSHNKSILDKKTWIDLPMRYQPYQEKFEKLIRFILR